MKNLKPPSLQHLSRVWHHDPKFVTKRLRNMVEHGPTFSYQPLHEAVRDHFAFQIPLERVITGFERIARESLRRDFANVLRLLGTHFKNIVPDYFKDFTALYYPIARDIIIPFNPPFMYAISGKVFLPWFSFWRAQPLTGERLSLFVTLARELLQREPDLCNADFHILDLHVGGRNNERKIRIIDCSQVPLLFDTKKDSMLAVFAQGFREARSELAKAANAPSQRKGPPSDQRSLFE